MSLSTVREDIIKDFVARELLDDNILPTLDMVCAIVLRDYRGVSLFKSMLTDRLLLNQNDPASRSGFNTTTKFAGIDISTLYKFVDFLSSRIDQQKAIIKQRLNQLSKAVEELNQKAQGIILLNEYSDGYLEVFTESFGNLNNINSDNTTALVDTSNHYATVKPRTVNPITNKTIKDISVSCITPSVISAKSLVGNDITQIYDGHDDTLWIYEVELPSSFIGSAEISLRVTLSEPTTINKILMKLNDGLTNEYEVKLLANINGWVTISDYSSFGNQADMAFDEITVTQLTLCIRTGKSTSRNGKLIYTFFGQELTLSDTDSTAVSVLELLPHTFSKPFRQLGFTIQKDLPGTSKVDLYASVFTNVWSDFVQIDPSNHLAVAEEDTYNKVYSAVDLTYTHPYNTGANISYEYSPSNVDFNYLKLRLIRNLGNFSKTGSVLKCYFHLDYPATIDFSIYPGSLDGVFVNTHIDIPSGMHSFSFNDSITQGTYGTFLTFNNIIFGSCLAKYVTPEDFVNIAEDDNLEVFTIKDRILAKAITRTEPIEFHSYVHATTTATQVKVKLLLTGLDQNNPKVKSINIKAA